MLLYKKGIQNKYDEYRGIVPSFVHIKLLPIILSNKMRVNVGKVTGFYQKGFCTHVK